MLAGLFRDVTGELNYSGKLSEYMELVSDITFD